MYIEEESVSMGIDSQRRSDNKPLTQEELRAWWPFTRLDPKRFPKQPRSRSAMPDDVEDALL